MWWYPNGIAVKGLALPIIIMVGYGMADRTFGQLVAHYRDLRGLSQEALGAESGISTRTVSAIEQGIIKDPRISTVKGLGKALGADFLAQAYHYSDNSELSELELVAGD